jgi:hypothetical protein
MVAVGTGLGKAQEARTLRAQLVVVDCVVALDGECLVEQEYNWQSGSCFGEYGDVP